MHGTVGLTGEFERRAAALDAQVHQLRGQVDALQTVTAGLDAIRLEVAGLAGPTGRLVATGSPWWSLLPFTAHRIQLAPRIYTADTGVEPDVDLRTKVILHAAGDAAGGLAGKRVIDIGCNEGGFSVEFARRGAAEVVGVEARPLSVRRGDLVRDVLGLANLRFACGDVLHELARAQQPFDVILATGILYHFAHPDAALRSMRERCSGFLLLCTHVAHPDASSHGCSDDIVEYVGEVDPGPAGGAGGRPSYRGRRYSERDVGPMADTGGDDLWAAWSNEESFWPFEADLVRMVHAAGFASVEKIDPGDHAEPWQVDHTNRVMYLCRV
jgi:SAM-dependent methyltransferase